MATREELEGWFKAIDKDGNGLIDQAELKEVMVKYHKEILKADPVDDKKVDDDVAGILKEVDSKGGKEGKPDGKIDKDEFFSYFLGEGGK